jgi:hypothetical protein
LCNAVCLCAVVEQQQGGAVKAPGCADGRIPLAACTWHPRFFLTHPNLLLFCVLQVWSSSKEVLSRRLGAQTGASLWQHAHGIDDRPVAPPKARKSVGADVNWGVRFSNAQEADTFLKVRGHQILFRYSSQQVGGSWCQSGCVVQQCTGGGYIPQGTQAPRFCSNK